MDYECAGCGRIVSRREAGDGMSVCCGEMVDPVTD